MSAEWGVKGSRSGEPPEIDTSVAHSARIYDYILGGKDNFEADRKAAEAPRLHRDLWINLWITCL